MKGALKYILLFVVACICSFIIYYYLGPEEEHHIGIQITTREKRES